MSDIALGLLEFDSIAAGIVAGDAMVKRAPVNSLLAGSVHNGKYLALVRGEVADVQEALDAGAKAAAPEASLFLARVDPAVAAAIAGQRSDGPGGALGVIETLTVAACIGAADAGVKGAQVTLRELRLANGLGGRAFLLFGGSVSDVEAAVEIGLRAVPAGTLVRKAVIASLHSEMDANLRADTHFAARVRGPGGTA